MTNFLNIFQSQHYLNNVCAMMTDDNVKLSLRQVLYAKHFSYKFCAEKTKGEGKKPDIEDPGTPSCVSSEGHHC